MEERGLELGPVGEVTGMYRLEDACVELLYTQFSGEDPNLYSEVGHCGLLMAVGRDPQSLVPDQLKFVQVGRGHLNEPNRGGVVKDGAPNCLMCYFGRETPAPPC